MLAIRVRDSPCSDFDMRSSSGRTTCSTPSSPLFTVIGSATTWLSVPLGPLTVTCCPSIVTSTSPGTGTGIFPMRLIAVPFSPDVGEDFPAYPTLGCLPVGQQARRRREDRGTQTGEHLARPVVRRIGDHKSGDVTLLLEDLGDVALELRMRHLYGLVERRIRVAQTREHVRDRVGHHRCFSFLAAVPGGLPRR